MPCKLEGLPVCWLLSFDFAEEYVWEVEVGGGEGGKEHLLTSGEGS